MKTDIISVSEDETVGRAKLLMEIKSIRFLPVTKGMRVLGILTARNLKNPRIEIQNPKVKHLYPNDDDIPVKYIMRTELITMLPNDHIATAARTLTTNKISSLPIVERKGSDIIVGVITTTDLLLALLELIDRGNI
ncbi:MAG: CBS domain-containing protein [Deltaproteobacteria bacterium]|nr:CBS domain-containing protein [Deltaproteobacteria bacterium]